MVDPEAVKDRLETSAADLAETLLGPHNKAVSSARQWRWGRKGSFKL